MSIDALVQQNISKVEALTASALSTDGSVSAVLATAQGLASSISSDDCPKKYADLQDRVAVLEQELQDSVAEAQACLEKLEVGLDDAETFVEQLSQSVEQSLSSLEDIVKEATAASRADCEELVAELSALASLLGEIDGEVLQGTETATTTYEQLKEIVSGVESALGEQNEALLAGLESFSEETDGHLDALVDTFANLEQEVNDKFEECEGMVAEKKSEAAEALASVLGEKVSEAQASSTEEMDGSLSMLLSSGEKAGELFDGGLGELVDKVDDVIAKLEPVLEVAQNVKSVLG